MITVGDIKLDTFVVLDDASLQCNLKMPECQLCLDYGAKIVVHDIDSQLAGTAPNVAVGLSRMGKKTAVISNMGPDITFESALKTLKEEKVDTRFINVIEGEKSAYSVVLNFQGEKTILTKHIHRAYKLPKNLPNTKWMYLSEMGPGYEMLYRSVIATAKNDGMFIGINPGTIQIEERKPQLFDLLKFTHVLFVNREEARTLSNATSLEIHHLAKWLWELGPDLVVITDGGNGSYSFDGNDIYFCPLFPGKFVEATGAGDSFATGYMAALMERLPHEEGLRWGSVNATSVVGFVGPQRGLLSIQEIKKRLKERPAFKAKKI